LRVWTITDHTRPSVNHTAAVGEQVEGSTVSSLARKELGPGDHISLSTKLGQDTPAPGTRDVPTVRQAVKRAAATACAEHLTPSCSPLSAIHAASEMRAAWVGQKEQPAYGIVREVPHLGWQPPCDDLVHDISHKVAIARHLRLEAFRCMEHGVAKRRAEGLCTTVESEAAHLRLPFLSIQKGVVPFVSPPVLGPQLEQNEIAAKEYAPPCTLEFLGPCY